LPGGACVPGENGLNCLKAPLWGLSFALKKPSALLNSDNKYVLDGEQRNRGLELNVFGEPVLGLRLNASTTWLDPEMTKTAGGTNDGHDAIGVSRFYAVVGAEYDIKPVDGLTATAKVNHTGSQYADAANTKKLDSYTTYAYISINLFLLNVHYLRFSNPPPSIQHAP
jgi:outer membrane receptor protein involved in Fe transport